MSPPPSMCCRCGAPPPPAGPSDMRGQSSCCPPPAPRQSARASPRPWRRPRRRPPPPVAVGGGSALGLTGISCNTSRISSVASTSCFAFISFFRSPARFFCAAPKKTDRRLAFSSSSLRFISRSLRILLRQIHASRQRSTTTLPCLRLWNSSIFLTMIGTISSRFASLSSSKKAALPARMKILYMPAGSPPSARRTPARWPRRTPLGGNACTKGGMKPLYFSWMDEYGMRDG